MPPAPTPRDLPCPAAAATGAARRRSPNATAAFGAAARRAIGRRHAIGASAARTAWVTHALVAATLCLPAARAQTPTPTPTPTPAPAPAPATAAAPAPAAVAQPDLSGCIAALRTGAAAAGVRAETYDRLTQGVQDLRPQIDRFTQSQPEFELKIWDYITRRVDAERVADGRQLLDSEAAALRRIDERHGVDAATVVAVYGIETDYGRVQGRYPVIDATLSRACLRLGSDERRGQFHAALWLVQEGHVKVEEFNGSWAGAFGKTQFMPGTFRAYMDDGDGSGTVDIINSTADALGTTARYLKALRWRDGLPWGVEVRADAALLAQAAVAQGNQPCLSGGSGGTCRSLAQWEAAGVRRVDGQRLFGGGSPALPADAREARAALFAPTGPQGPVWLITQNYRAIWQYNRADAYALAIGLLSDRLRGSPGPRTPWPTDDPGVSRAEFREIQTLLRARGACDVVPDGRDGPRTSAAIREIERAQGWPESGLGGVKVLRVLRAQAARVPGVAAAESAPAAGGACPPLPPR